MTGNRTKTGKRLERAVAQLYRDLGARKVAHDVEVAGHQIDVYVELETWDRGVHRIAVEAKDHGRPVGTEVVSTYTEIIERLRRLGQVDEGVVVAMRGFTKPARRAAADSSVRLLELEDLESLSRQRKTDAFFGEMREALDHVHQEMRSHGEQLQRLNHVFEAVRAARHTGKVIPGDVGLRRGVWKDSLSGSTFWIAHSDPNAVAPYCDGGDDELTGVLYDFQAGAENAMFARFQWIESAIRGFAYVELLDSDKASGGWWFVEDLPADVLQDLERLHSGVPGMVELDLKWTPMPKNLPVWVQAGMVSPSDYLLDGGSHGME